MLEKFQAYNNNNNFKKKIQKKIKKKMKRNFLKKVEKWDSSEFLKTDFILTTQFPTLFLE